MAQLVSDEVSAWSLSKAGAHFSHRGTERHFDTNYIEAL